MNDFEIDCSCFLHQLLEDVSPNVPSFFATYFWKMFLQNFIIVDFPSFSANPRRHVFYLGFRMILIHAPLSSTSIFHEKQFRKLSKCRSVFESLFFDVHDYFGIDFRYVLFIELLRKMAPKMDCRVV